MAFLAAEVESVLRGRPPVVADVPRLQYVERVLLEGMRLYPPTWIFVRVPLRDDVLPGGFRVPAGSKLYLSPYATHRNARYFPDPNRFDPDRFTETARKARPPMAYFPFAVGPRACLGQAFALLEGVLVLASLSQRVRLELMPGPPVLPLPRQTLAPRNGIWMEVRPRDVASAPAARQGA